MIYQTFEVECDRCKRTETVRMPLNVSSQWGGHGKPRSGRMHIKVTTKAESATVAIFEKVGFTEHYDEDLCASCQHMKEQLDELAKLK